MNLEPISHKGFQDNHWDKSSCFPLHISEIQSIIISIGYVKKKIVLKEMFLIRIAFCTLIVYL